MSYYHGILKMLSVVLTRSFRSLRSCWKTQKTRTQSLIPLSFGSFCSTLMTQRTQCEPGFRKKFCLQEVPMRFTERWPTWKKPLRKTKEHALLVSFKHVLHAGQVMIRHPRGENTIFSLLLSPMIILRVPVTFAKIKCRRGLAKDFTSLQDSHTRSYDENLL